MIAFLVDGQMFTERNDTPDMYADDFQKHFESVFPDFVKLCTSDQSGALYEPSSMKMF